MPRHFSFAFSYHFGYLYIIYFINGDLQNQISRTESPLHQTSSFYFWRLFMNGIEVLHSLHVFFDGFPRYSTFVLLIIWLVSCILFSSLFLLCCFSLFCIPFWFLIFCNYLSKKKKIFPSLCALKNLDSKFKQIVKLNVFS